MKICDRYGMEFDDDFGVTFQQKTTREIIEFTLCNQCCKDLVVVELSFQQITIQDVLHFINRRQDLMKHP